MYIKLHGDRREKACRNMLEVVPEMRQAVGQWDEGPALRLADRWSPCRTDEVKQNLNTQEVTTARSNVRPSLPSEHNANSPPL
jgi:hypothetical protein